MYFRVYHQFFSPDKSHDKNKGLVIDICCHASTTTTIALVGIGK
jgi:hypothetical protein